jgi:hypothetical protein
MRSIVTSWFNRGYNSSTCYQFHLAYISKLGVRSSVWEANSTLAMRLAWESMVLWCTIVACTGNEILKRKLIYKSLTTCEILVLVGLQSLLVLLIFN